MSPNCLQTLLWPIWLKTNVAVAVAFCQNKNVAVTVAFCQNKNVTVVLNLAID